MCHNATYPMQANERTTSHCEGTFVVFVYCSTTGEFSKKRHFSMNMSSTHIPSQGLGRPEELVFSYIPKCAERRD
jgi:hypothetical protein